MAYRNRFGSTDLIKGRYENLSIGWDYVANPEDARQRYPVLLFIPDMKKQEHYHLELDRKKAKVLHKWLSDYLGNKPTTHKKGRNRGKK